MQEPEAFVEAADGLYARGNDAGGRPRQGVERVARARGVPYHVDGDQPPGAPGGLAAHRLLAVPRRHRHRGCREELRARMRAPARQAKVAERHLYTRPLPRLSLPLHILS